MSLALAEQVASAARGERARGRGEGREVAGAESHRTLSCGKDFSLYSERHRKPLGKILLRGGV